MLEVSAASGAAVTWKAVWMTLMVCCAVRQLLSCIQVSQSKGWGLVVGGGGGEALSNGRKILILHQCYIDNTTVA